MLVCVYFIDMPVGICVGMPVGLCVGTPVSVFLMEKPRDRHLTKARFTFKTWAGSKQK